MIATQGEAGQFFKVVTTKYQIRYSVDNVVWKDINEDPLNSTSPAKVNRAVFIANYSNVECNSNRGQKCSISQTSLSILFSLTCF